MRVVAVLLLLSAGIAAEAMSYSFVSKGAATGGLIRFSFTVIRPHVPRPISSHSPFLCGPPMTGGRRCRHVSGRRLTQPIQNGFTPPGFTTIIRPQSSFPVAFTKGSLEIDTEALIWRDFQIRWGGKITLQDSFSLVVAPVRTFLTIGEPRTPTFPHLWSFSPSFPLPLRKSLRRFHFCRSVPKS